MFLKLFFAFLTFAIAMPTYAQLFTIDVLDYGLASGNPAFPAFKALVDSEVAKIETDINKDLPSAQPQRLMEGMANSSVMAGKGIGSDYASNMSVFLIGAGVGVGADLAKDKDTDSDLSGLGVAPGVIIGMNLGWMDSATFLGMDTNRLNLYMNYMSYTHEQSLGDKEGKKSSAKLDMMALGVHMRYDWIKGNGSRIFGWGGVKFHFGYEYNKTNIEFNSQINEAVNSTSGSGPTQYTVTGNVKGNPSALIQAKTHSIPLELSTDIQFLYFVSMYTGIGADYNFGEASGKGALNAEQSNINCSGGAGCTAASNPSSTVQANANIDAKGKVNPFLFRGFAGVQLNLPWTRIFVQVDKAIGNDLVGATTGVRFAF